MTKNKTLLPPMMLAFMLFSPHALAVDSSELIEARQGLMKLYSVNMDVIGEMLHGVKPYNKKTAKEAADNLLALSR